MSDKPLRKHPVWAICRLYSPNFSGAAIQAHRILCRLGQELPVRVLSAADHESIRLGGQKKELDGVEIRYLRVPRRRDWKWLGRWTFLRNRFVYWNQQFSDLCFNLKITWTILCRSQQNDMVLLYSTDEFSLLPILACRIKKIPSVIQMSLLGADDPGSFSISTFSVLTRIKLAAFNYCDLVIGLSSALTDSCASAGIPSTKIIRIPNGVDPEIFFDASERKTEIRDALGLAQDRMYVSFVGSALHRKGIDVVVRAFVEVTKELADVDLLIVGNYEFTDHSRNEQSRRDLVFQLQTEAEQAGIANRIRWLGQIDHVDQILKASDLFFFPTRREGLPNAVAEAMACGLPVVASKLQGITTDLVDDGVHGLLVDGFEPGRYAKAIIALLKDNQRREQMSLAASQRIRTDFDLPKIVQQYRRLPERLHGQKETTTMDGMH